MVQQCGLQLIPSCAMIRPCICPMKPHKGHGPHQKYGDRLDYQHLPAEYLMQTTTTNEIEFNFRDAKQYWGLETS